MTSKLDVEVHGSILDLDLDSAPNSLVVERLTAQARLRGPLKPAYLTCTMSLEVKLQGCTRTRETAVRGVLQLHALNTKLSLQNGIRPGNENTRWKKTMQG